MARSGVITITTGGDVEPGPDEPGVSFMLVYNGGGAAKVGDASGQDYPLTAGSQLPVYCNNLKALSFTSDTDGDTIAWFKVR